MKKLITCLLAVALATVALPSFAGEKKPAKSPAKETGAEVGAWTQDHKAALALAKEKNLPVLMNFTGSDWCPLCILMEEKVFTAEAWNKWAKENIVMVFIDFPKNKRLVPMAYVTRNNMLCEKYGVDGSPTYILLASDGEKILGQLDASCTATPEKFIADIEKLLKPAAGAEKQ